MWMWLIGAALAEPTDLLDEHWLIRVDDPNAPGAVARSRTGSVLTEAPAAGTPWRWEPPAEVDQQPEDPYNAGDMLRATNADLWHEAGFRGQGVRIGVLDPAWLRLDEYWDQVQPETVLDCWQHPECLAPMEPNEPRTGGGQGVHGTACAEVVRDMAPEAEIHVLRVGGGTTLENAVEWAIRNEIDLLSFSVSLYNEDFYDGSAASARLMAKLAANDVLMVTSAGNNARQHWMGSYVDADGDGRMDFDGSNGLALELSKNANIYLNWDQHQRCGDTDLDLVLVGPDGREVGWASATQSATADQCSPVERLTADLDDKAIYVLEVHHRRGVEAYLAMDILTRNGAIVGAIPEGSIANPGAHPAALAVGAVPVQSYLTSSVEGFSSYGPTHGGHAKPEIAGPDGIVTKAYGGSGFYGTSASTPAVTGLIALVMSREPDLTAAQAADRLRSWSLTDAPVFSEPDPRWGSGKARLPVLDSEQPGCGRRALIAFVWLLPPWWFRRRTPNPRQDM